MIIQLFLELLIILRDYIEKSKYIEFRASKHFNKNFLNEDEFLPSNQIVAMNMGFKKTENFLKIGLFDKDFLDMVLKIMNLHIDIKKIIINLKLLKLQ